MRTSQVKNRQLRIDMRPGHFIVSVICQTILKIKSKLFWQLDTQISYLMFCPDSTKYENKIIPRILKSMICTVQALKIEIIINFRIYWPWRAYWHHLHLLWHGGCSQERVQEARKKDIRGFGRGWSVLYSFLVLLSITASLHCAGNGSLDEDEFVKGCLTDPDFSRVIQHSIEKLKVQAD